MVNRLTVLQFGNIWRIFIGVNRLTRMVNRLIELRFWKIKVRNSPKPVIFHTMTSRNLADFRDKLETLPCFKRMVAGWSESLTVCSKMLNRRFESLTERVAFHHFKPTKRSRWWLILEVYVAGLLKMMNLRFGCRHGDGLMRFLWRNDEGIWIWSFVLLIGFLCSHAFSLHPFGFSLSRISAYHQPMLIYIMNMERKSEGGF